MYDTYLWVKSFHLLFVMAWMGGVFYLPRILVNLAEAGDQPAVRARLVLMGRRLYRFGHHMFGLAALLGVFLWLGHRMVDGFPTMVGSPAGWLHAKLLLMDNKRALVGSMNIDRSAFDLRRELGVITHEAHTIKALGKVFEHDWKEAKPYEAPDPLKPESHHEGELPHDPHFAHE